MSEGPIKAWRDAWAPKRVTTKPTASVHWARDYMTTYCGRRGRFDCHTDVRQVTCSDCLAALRADGVIA